MHYLLEFFILFGAIRAAWADPMFRALAVAVAFQLALGTTFYSLVEGWSVIDALYFCVVSSLTVGFGDLVPETNLGKLFTVLYLLTTVSLFVAFGTQIASVIIEQRHERLAARRERRSKSQEPGSDRDAPAR